jgi:hypothetical protein
MASNKPTGYIRELGLIINLNVKFNSLSRFYKWAF